MTNITQLYETLAQRKRPEDVAEMIIELSGNTLTTNEHRVLEKAAQGSLKRRFFGYTSMLQEFANIIGAGKQVSKAIEIFKLEDVGEMRYDSSENIEAFILSIAPLVNKTVGGNNFKKDRLNKAQRKQAGLDLSKRNYNKKWRIIKRLENKLKTFIQENRKKEFQLISKHGFAHHLDFVNFSKDLNTACFIAYYNARCNLRSVFTSEGQERPFDEICEMLLQRCSGESANWWAISYIYTSQNVLSHLTNEQKGELLGRWTTVLQDIASLLAEVWDNNDINRDTMVVKKGNDSTTWNNTAGAWNKARDNWMNLIFALGLDSILDDICFGKVLRLMAADVVALHFFTGGKLDPNTEVWRKLPLPWEVFKGVQKCNKETIIDLCKDAGLDAEKSGWIAPRTHGVVEFRPTPELVNGVIISNPFLATVLKQHKYFSGKSIKLFDAQNN